MASDFATRVEALLRSEHERRLSAAQAATHRDRIRRLSAETFVDRMRPIGREAFAALVEVGLRTEQVNVEATNQKGAYISFIGKLPHHNGFFLPGLSHLHSNGLLIGEVFTTVSHGAIKDHYRYGNLLEPPIMPSSPSLRQLLNVRGELTWYDEHDLIRDFVRRYRPISGGNISTAATDQSDEMPKAEGQGLIYIDLAPREAYVIWHNSSARPFTGDGHRLSEILFAETLVSYFKRLVQLGTITFTKSR